MFWKGKRLEILPYGFVFLSAALINPLPFRGFPDDIYVFFAPANPEIRSAEGGRPSRFKSDQPKRKMKRYFFALPPPFGSNQMANTPNLLT